MPRHVRHLRHRRYIRHDRHDPFAQVEEVGQIQFSADGVDWVDSIPAGTMKVDTDLDFYVRVNPETLSPDDDGSYEYDFAMATVGSGGLSLVNGSGDARNTAHITGSTPADQVGITFQVNGLVKDIKGNSIAGTNLTQDWVAA